MSRKDKPKVSDLRLTIAVTIIYTVVAVLLAVGVIRVFYCDMRATDISSFIGSYAGGALGGLGALLAVFLTIRHSLKVQAENSKEAADRMTEQNNINQKEHDRERNARQAEQERSARQAFADSIAEQLGVYITHISKYYFEAPKCEKLDEEVRQAYEELRQKEAELESVRQAQVSGPGVSNNPSNELERKRAELEQEVAELKEAYQRKQDEEREHSRFAMRIEANEAYFIIETKLSGITEGASLLSCLQTVQREAGMDHDEPARGSWMEGKSKELMEEYREFSRRYVGSRGVI